MQIHKVGLSVLLAFALFVPCALAQEDSDEPAGVTCGVSTSLVSKYVSRGAVISDGPVIQPEGWVEYNGLTFDIWNNVDLADDQAAPRRLTDTDFAVEYAFSLSKADLALGYIYYTFPNLHIADTQEMYLSACLDVFLQPAVTVYWDVDQVGGTYTNASLTYSTALVGDKDSPTVGAELSAAVGYGDAGFIGGCFEASGAGFVDLVVSAQTPVKLSEHVSLVPSLSYARVLDSDLRRCCDTNDVVYGGVGLVAEF